MPLRQTRNTEALMDDLSLKIYHLQASIEALRASALQSNEAFETILGIVLKDAEELSKLATERRGSKPQSLEALYFPEDK